MKKKTLAFTIISCFLAIIAISVVICAIIANSKNDKTSPNEMLASWQNLITDEALVKNIALPGAHDAGTSGMPYYVETQDRSIADLLQCGTRYFDLRVSYSDERLRIYHGPSKGTDLDVIIDDIKEFLQTHTSETLILDFQHFDNGDIAQTKTLSLIEDKLNGFMLINDTDKPDTEFIDTLTLNRARGKAIVVWGRENNDILSKNYIFKRNNDDGTRSDSVLHSYYKTELNTKSSEKYIAEALPQYIQAYKETNYGLFVLQGQLTDGMYIFGPRFREATHFENMNEYVKSLASSPDLYLINIIMRDFVSPKKNCLTLQLNIEKGLVKSNQTTDYNSLISSFVD